MILCSVTKLALGLGCATVEGCRAAEDNGLRTVLLWFIWGYSPWYLGIILGLTDGTRRHSGAGTVSLVPGGTEEGGSFLHRHVAEPRVTGGGTAVLGCWDGKCRKSAGFPGHLPKVFRSRSKDSAFPMIVLGSHPRVLRGS